MKPGMLHGSMRMRMHRVVRGRLAPQRANFHGDPLLPVEAEGVGEDFVEVRNPSHLGSYDHTPGSSGTLVAALANFGLTGAARGDPRFPYSRRPPLPGNVIAEVIAGVVAGRQ